MKQWPFYRADDSKVGDVMPCYFNGHFYIYYLRFGVYGEKAYNEWSVRETEDFVHFSEDRRVGIFGGTGEIFPFEGKYHLFKEVEPNIIGHYIGETPYAFEDTGDRIPSDDNWYVPWAWRDPKIFWVEEEQCYWMLVATNRKTGNPVCRHGCVGLLKSKDLFHWDYCPPLYSPLAFDGTYECPDMFRMGDWYYLLYSNANVNKTTHYVKSKSRYGPWQMPKNDTLDSFLFYAGRTASNGKDRYVVAWNAERTGQDLSMTMGLRDVDKTPLTQYTDFAPLGYAGDMVCHKLGQRPDGDLTLEPIDTVVSQFCRELPIALQTLQGNNWTVCGKTIEVSSPEIYSCALAQQLPERCLIEVIVKTDGHEAGLAIGADGSFIGRGLFLRLQPKYGRLNVTSGLRDRPYVGYCLPFAVEQEMFIPPETGGSYRFRILRDGELLTVYLNGEALSLRSENSTGGNLGFFAFDSDLCVSDLRVLAAEEEC